MNNYLNIQANKKHLVTKIAKKPNFLPNKKISNKVKRVFSITKYNIKNNKEKENIDLNILTETGNYSLGQDITSINSERPIKTTINENPKKEKEKSKQMPKTKLIRKSCNNKVINVHKKNINANKENKKAISSIPLFENYVQKTFSSKNTNRNNKNKSKILLYKRTFSIYEVNKRKTYNNYSHMNKINNSDIYPDQYCTHKEKTKSADVSPKSEFPIKLIIKNKNNKSKNNFDEKNNKKNKSLVIEQNKRKTKGALKLSMNINQNKSKIIDKGKFKDKDKDKDKNNKKVSFASSIIMNKSLKKEPLNKNPQMVEEYFDDIYKYLKSIENSDLPKENYMKDVQKDINEKMRKILLDWLIDVHAKFNLLPETLFLTITIIDRYLSKKSINRKYLQLLGVTAMFLCSKYEDIYPPEIKDFIFMTDNAYTHEELVKMESDILEKIQFNMTYPTSLRFLEIYKKILNLKEIDFNRCRYLIEIALFDYHCCHFPPSLIASTCVYFNYKINKHKNKNLKLIESKLLSSIEYDLKEITPCLNCLIKAFKQMVDINNTYTSILRKFAKKEYMKISSEKIDINNIFVNNIK